MIQCPISIGELFDKISILEIKKDKISSSEALSYINEELDLLLVIKSKIPGANTSSKLCSLYLQLVTINISIWDNENQRREYERLLNFNSGFIEASRLSFKLNDERARIKREINSLSNSPIREFKSY